MSLHYLVKHNMCQSVHNHSNASIKRHDRLTVMGKHIVINVQSVGWLVGWLAGWGLTALSAQIGHIVPCFKCLPLA